jgi:formate dehydrogenase major subunit
MVVFAQTFGKLAERLSSSAGGKQLQARVGTLPNVLSKRSKQLESRLHGAEKFRSVCPYCAVGCGQLVYAKNGKVIDIEGDPESPVSGGCLCPKGSASFQLVSNPNRITQVMYRAPYSKEWVWKPLDWAMERIAQRVKETREATFVENDKDGNPINHTLGMGSLGGATLDNEENYLITKLFHAIGMVAIENQARI